MPEIIRTDRADEDLIEIWLYVATDDPSAADRVLDAIEARWLQLVRHPYSGIARDDIAPGVRQLVVGRYFTLYRLVADGVEILRVIHVSRRLGRQSLD